MLVWIIVMAPFILLGLWANHNVGSSFRRWSQVPSSSGRSGAEIARAILDRNGLHDVPVRRVAGELSDHYDPRDRSVSLSAAVHDGRSIASVSVAAHEVGHAIQHKVGYTPMSIRSSLAPVAAFGSSAFMPLFLVGVVLAAIGSTLGTTVFGIAVALYAVAVLFQIVTLPVEFNASSRARTQLTELALVGGDSQQMKGTGQVLNAAALTYVAAALAAAAQLVWLALSFLRD